MNNPSSSTESDLNPLWNEDYTEDRIKRLFNEVNPYIRNYLRENESSGALLDLGCGYGHMSMVFEKTGFRVTGIDGDSERIEEAKKRHPGVVFQSLKIVDKLPFDDNSFDVIFSRSVFQYFEHAPMLEECRRVLKKGGDIILLENLKNNPVTRMGRIILKLSKHDYHSYPWNHFTLAEISNLQEDFENSSLQCFHILSPLAYTKVFKKLHPVLYKMDQKILQLPFMRNFAWLGLFTAKNK